MDKKTVFVKTDSGESEINGQSDKLYGDAKRILHLVDDESTVAEISKRAPPSLRDEIYSVLQELVDGGFIRDMRAPVNVPQKPTLKMATPAFKMAVPKPVSAPPRAPQVTTPSNGASNFTKPSLLAPSIEMPALPIPDKKKIEPAKATSNGDLDFSFITSGTGANVNETKEKAEAAANALAKSKQDSERLKAEQSAQIEATAKAAKLKAYEEAKERAKIEVAAKARIDAEARLKNESEAAKLKAEQEVLKARAELEATKARVEAEARTRIEAELKQKQEAEAARLKVEKDAEKARNELAAARAKAELEMRVRLEVEARAKAEEEARKKREIETERLRVEKERAEKEIARIKAEAEQKMREEAEKRVRAEVEARLKAEADERMRLEAEAELKRVEKERADLERARVRAETEQKLRADAEIRIRAEVEARLKAEEKTKQGDQSGIFKEKLGSSTANFGKVDASQLDPAEKLRQSFVESFGQNKNKPISGPLNFKLDTFSFDVSGQKSPETAPTKPAQTVPGGGSKVKAAFEQKAQREAEEKRIKAEAEAARLKAEQAEAARIKMEQDAARLKAEQEAYRLKVAQDEEKARVEAEQKKLAEQQSKQWEEAQQRAAATHEQMEKERLAKQAAEEQLKSRQARGPRKPFPIGKIVAGLFTLALIAVAGLPYIWPTEEYIKPLETEITAHLNQPVKISKISFSILPLPKLELGSVVVGSGSELTVENVIINFDFSALFAQTRSINSLELNNVTVSGASLDKALAWLQAAGGMERYPVARMELSRVGLKSNEVKLPLLSGKSEFDLQGKFTKAVLKSEDDKFIFEMQALPKGFNLELNIHGNSLPIFPSVKFNDLSTTGVLDNGEFVFSDFFAHIHGGTVTGKGRLIWSNGWKLEGQLNAKSLELQSLFPNFGVTGQVYGDVSLSMYGPVLAQLDNEPRMDGSFEAKDGVLNKLDIDTIARFGTQQGGGGRTNFSELTGTLKADKRSQRFYLNKIEAGSVKGSGIFEVDEMQQLTGKLMVEVKGVANPNILLQLSGTPVEPLLKMGR